MSPLKGLPNLALRLGLGGIWVKDESARLNLGSFKVLGGSYAIYQLLKKRLGLDNQDIPFSELTGGVLQKKLGNLIFAAATDGNHGRGVAWSASQMGFKSIIYVHKLTSHARIKAIEQNGAKVVVIDGTYDDAVRQLYTDAQRNGWEVISDTAWEGYESIPKWVMQGYTTMLSEVQEQLAGQGLDKPTHVFVQAGVGSLAAATIGYYYNLFSDERPQSIVVEPTKAGCLYQSAKIGNGKPYSVKGALDTIMAGLACGDPNPLAWQILFETADFFSICPDYIAAKGMRVYGIPLKGDPFIVSGESGAVTLGALMYIMEYEGAKSLRDKLGLGLDSQILLINSEGNTSPDDFRHVVWEGGIPIPDEYKIYGRQ
jgi:diaminopropionate ammonia-lyase